MDEKSRNKKGFFGQKFSPDDLRRAYILLIYLSESSYFPSQIASKLGLSRQVVDYWIAKLEHEGLIFDRNPESNKYKLYGITPAGQNFLATNEGTVTPRGKVTNENARFKCDIRNLSNLSKFLLEKSYNFVQNNIELRNNIVYHGIVEGVHVTVRHPAARIDKATLEMRSPKFSANTGNEGVYLMFNMMMRFQDWLDERWHLDLSRIHLDSDHLELAWDSPYARAKMTQTKGNPVRTPLFNINQSPPSLKPKEEWHDPDELDRHIMLPDMVDSIRKEIEDMKTDGTSTSYKIDQLEMAVRSLAESMKMVAEASKTTDTNIANLATNLTEIAKSIQGKNNTEQGKPEQKELPLNDSTKSIYG